MKEWFQITTNQKCVKRITKYLKLFNHTNYHIYDKDNNNNDEVIIEVFGYRRLKQYKEYLKKYAMEVKLLQYEFEIYIVLFLSYSVLMTFTSLL